MRETCILSLGWEDHLEEDMATHFAWKIPMDKRASIAFLCYVLREATLYVLDLFKVLQFDWMAASVITFYNRGFV